MTTKSFLAALPPVHGEGVVSECRGCEGEGRVTKPFPRRSPRLRARAGEVGNKAKSPERFADSTAGERMRLARAERKPT